MHSRRLALVKHGRSRVRKGNIEVTLIETASSRQEGLNPGFSRLLVQSGSFLINARSAPHAIQFLETGVSVHCSLRSRHTMPQRPGDSEHEPVIFRESECGAHAVLDGPVAQPVRASA